MPAYLIVDVQVTDPVRYADYITQVPPTLAQYGGRYLARGGRAERMEGDWNPNRVVVVEFPSFEQAKAWWACNEYRAPKSLRQSAAITRMVLVDGVPPA